MTRRNKQRRSGKILVLSAFLMVGMMSMLAFSIDVGYLYVARDQLQRSADSPALAATWELIDESGLYGNTNVTAMENNARTKADEYAALNSVLNAAPLLANDDVEIGYMSDPSDPNCQMDLNSTEQPNAVRVRIRRSAQQNGTVPLFFARVLGFEQTSTEASATAALLNNINGFRIPPGNRNVEFLPFALDEGSANQLLANQGQDLWTYDDDTGAITAGPDGIAEVNLYPQGTGAPGNRGTVDVGSNNNSTADLSRQILNGISPSDLAFHGGRLEFDANGKIYLNGDTGISAGIKDELAAIKGLPRVIPVFSTVTGNGNNAHYTIVNLVGVRVVDVKLNGSMSSKRVMVQKANVLVHGAIASGNSGTSHHVYSPVWLVR